MIITHSTSELLATATFALEVSTNLDDEEFEWMVSVEKAAAPNDSAIDTIHALMAEVSAFILRCPGLLWGETHDRWSTADAAASLIKDHIRNQSSERASILAGKALEAGKL